MGQTPASPWVRGPKAVARRPPLKRKLRRAAGWRVFGQKDQDQFKLSTKGNPSDDPSRRAELRRPAAPQEWMTPLIAADLEGPEGYPSLELPDWEPQGARLGSRLDRPVWCAIGRRWTPVLDAAEELGGLIGRVVPDPSKRNEWKGRTLAGWRTRWSSLIHDIDNRLCGVLLIAVSTRPGGLVDRPQSKLGGKSPQSISKQTCTHGQMHSQMWMNVLG